MAAQLPGESPEAAAPADRIAQADARSSPFPIDQLVRNVAVVAGAFYVLGFLTTNAYLYTLGVSDFSLLRTRFILTGVLVLTPIILALIWGIYVAVDLTVYRGDGLSWRTYTFVLADIAVPFLLYFALFAFVGDNDVATSARDAAALSVICALIVLVLLAALALYRVSGRRPLSHLAYRGRTVSYDRFSERFGVPVAVVESMVFVVVGIVLVLVYIGLFGQYFYPRIPEQLGGGRPRTAQILFGASAVPAARQLGLHVTEDAPLSQPVELLWQGEESYAVRLPAPRNHAVVQINSRLVDGVVTNQVLAPSGDEDGF